jgi:hypothetical protein
MDCFVAFAPRNDIAESAPPRAVIPRECGVSSKPRPFGSITEASEYWIARWSLSSGSPKARPGGGR